MRIFEQYKKLTIILLFFLLFVCCTKEDICEDRQVLAVINDTVRIYLDEFIERAEYTIRPVYCNRDYYVHKKIVLNSLIAEKLMAIEERQNNSNLLNNESFNAYVKGRKEQAIREELYNREAVDKVKISDEEINLLYPNVQREYEVEYYSFNDIALYDELSKLSGFSDEKYYQIFNSLNTDQTVIPRRKVKWDITENYDVLRTLFYETIDSTKILQPVRTGYRSYLWIKVIDWNTNKVISEDQQKSTLASIDEVAKKINAGSYWAEFVGEVMKGKSIVFDKDVLNTIGELYFQKYFVNRHELDNDDAKRILEDSDPENKEIFDLTLEMKKNNLMDKKFFEVDGQEWKVKDFQKLLASHPLVYRNRKMSGQEFPQEFQLAVVDLIRDHFVTEYGYNEKIDKTPEVRQETRMWKDSFLAQYNKFIYVMEHGDSTDFANLNELKMIQNHLNAYVDELQSKYYKKIEIDFDLFEAVKLTNIDLLARNNMMPYKTIVPQFPKLTTDYHLEYTMKMKKEK